MGGLFGVMESAESLAGLVGPTLGGLLSKLHPFLPIATVVTIYGTIFVVVFLFYHDCIVAVTPRSPTSINSETLPEKVNIAESAIVEVLNLPKGKSASAPRRTSSSSASTDFQSPYSLRSKKLL